MFEPMRVPLIAIAVSLWFVSGCQTCPDGDTSGSLFCHAGNCADGESVCGGVCTDLDTDRDNCGTCGTTCGDGLVCAGGQCVEGCTSGRINCAGVCVDPASDEANCGGCGVDDPTAVCAADETCLAGTCGCAAGELTCNGTCTDPQTSNQHCGATGDCLGANAGTMCMANQGCLNGTCVSRLIDRGSLLATNGRWTYMGMLGLNGANAACEMRWPGSKICTFDQLQMASMRMPAETMGAVDHNGGAVTSWWIDDTAALGTQRCQSNADAIPWSYGTADQGHVGKFVTLTPATGAITMLQTGALPSCNGSRHVPCCSTVVAP